MQLFALLAIRLAGDVSQSCSLNWITHSRLLAVASQTRFPMVQ